MYTPNGVRLDTLFTMNPMIIIDPEGRDKTYKYWRAQTMGAVALNLADGRSVLNTNGGDISHWSDDYNWVRRTAETMAEWGTFSDNQFTRADQERLAQLAGLEISHVTRLALPIGIVALRDPTELPPAPDGYPGFKRETPVRLDQLDAHSLAALQDIFELTVTQS